MTNADDRRFPIQGGLTISWGAAERAYRVYASLFGFEQSLERICERGGFGILEYAVLYNYPTLGSPFGDMVKPLRDGKISWGIERALVEGDVRCADRGTAPDVAFLRRKAKEIRSRASRLLADTTQNKPEADRLDARADVLEESADQIEKGMHVR